MPDFDIDFCMERRDEVIEYVQDEVRQRPRRRRSSPMELKARERDPRRRARASEWTSPRPTASPSWSRSSSASPPSTRRSREDELKPLYQAEDEVPASSHRPARSLEGLERNAGMHAAGVVIAPSVLTEFVPLLPRRRRATTASSPSSPRTRSRSRAWSSSTSSASRRSPSSRPRCRRSTARGRRRGAARHRPAAHGRRGDLRRYDRARRPTGVFQLESRGFREILRRQLKPDCFEDIVAAGRALPAGPARVRDGRRLHRPQARPQERSIDYRTRRSSRSSSPTYGVIVYQEQVMQIAQVLAGYTLAAPTCCAARWARRSPRRWPSRRAGSSRAPRRNVAQAHRGADLRPDGEVRRLRLQQVALGRVRAAHLPDRLAQGALPGCVHGGVLSSDMTTPTRSSR